MQEQLATTVCVICGKGLTRMVGVQLCYTLAVGQSVHVIYWALLLDANEDRTSTLAVCSLFI